MRLGSKFDNKVCYSAYSKLNIRSRVYWHYTGIVQLNGLAIAILQYFVHQSTSALYDDTDR